MEATIEQERNIGHIVRRHNMMPVLSLSDIEIGDTLLLPENHGRTFKRFRIADIDATSRHFIQFYNPQAEASGIQGYEILERTNEGHEYRTSVQTPSVMIQKTELSQGIVYKERKRMISF